jgi:hypothetical protein
MRVLYYSDLHTEILESQTREVGWTMMYPLSLGPDLDVQRGYVDLVILAGDIGMFRETRSVTAQGYAKAVSDYLSCPVVLVPGNHEYYGGSFPGDRDDLLRTPLPGVTVLDREVAYFPHPSGQLRVLGATLWTDYAVLGNQQQAMDRARTSIADHRRISSESGDTFRPEDALAEHLKSRKWISDRLGELHVGPTIIVTHHVPHPAARNLAFAPNDSLLPIFVSDCDDLIAKAGSQSVSAWIFGHHHYCVDVGVSGVPLLSAQPGYPGEKTGWRGPGVLVL